MRAPESPPGALRIATVETPRQWRDFHHVPYRVYAGDSNWVPPLLLERRLHYSPKHNPFFQHAKAAFWVAYRGGEPVGRISAQIDALHLERYGDATGHFGSLEAVDDAEVFAQLLRTAESWLDGNGMRRTLGPVTFSMWDQPGLLVEGFDTPPCVMMNHARPYFARHIEVAGYKPIQDLLAYRFIVGEPFPPAVRRMIARTRGREDVTVRPLRKTRQHFDEEVAIILDIMNDAWSDNWGFVPLTAAEIADLAGVLRLLLAPQDVAIAEHEGRPAAFCLIFPNLNEAIRDLGGRLAPFGWAKLFWRLMVKGTRTGRMPLMGVRKAYHASPLGAALALSVIEEIRAFHHRKGSEWGELSWILDQNERVKHIIDLAGAKAYKRYRIYERTFA
ncbi:MAG TPA: dATP pyrophosphohydrolase [Xanthobacteraceae bacterium]|nr:dATP pyrophosphohydrolase [Xanthobacteraceae bacterium]